MEIDYYFSNDFTNLREFFYKYQANVHLRYVPSGSNR